MAKSNMHIAGVHAAVGAVAGDVDDVVTVHHAHIRNLLRAGRDALQKRLHDARQACRLQVGLAQAQYPWREPKQLAVGGHIAQVLQRQQVAACGGARHATALAGLAGGHARVGIVKGFDDGQAFFQTGNPVFLVQAGQGRVGQGWWRTGGAWHGQILAPPQTANPSDNPNYER